MTKNEIIYSYLFLSDIFIFVKLIESQNETKGKYNQGKCVGMCVHIWNNLHVLKISIILAWILSTGIGKKYRAIFNHSLATPSNLVIGVT